MSSAHNFIPLGRCESVEQLISYHLCRLEQSNFIVIISILSVFMHHHAGFQDQLKEMKVEIGNLNTSLTRARQSLLENDSKVCLKMTVNWKRKPWFWQRISEHWNLTEFQS